jgi:hypothetical protein
MALQKYGRPSKDVKLSVLYKAEDVPETALMDGISKIFNKGLLADVTLIVGEGKETFKAHKLVLAAKSAVLEEMFSYGEDRTVPCEVRLYEVCAGAMRAFLDFVYNGEYKPRNEEVNKDVLKLASQFRMPDLVEKCAEELAKNITTTNVVGRLQLCDEFGLLKLRNKIMQQLTSNKKALQDVAQSPQLVQNPHLMQEMLGLIAQEGAKDATTPKKRKKPEVTAQEASQEATPAKRMKQEMLSLTAHEEAQEAAQTKRKKS